MSEIPITGADPLADPVNPAPTAAEVFANRHGILTPRQKWRQSCFMRRVAPDGDLTEVTFAVPNDDIKRVLTLIQEVPHLLAALTLVSDIANRQNFLASEHEDTMQQVMWNAVAMAADRAIKDAAA